MNYPNEALAVLTTTAKTTSQGSVYFWCKYLIDGEPSGSVWMPDEELQWAECLDIGTKVLVEKLKQNSIYLSRVSGIAKSLSDQTAEVLSLVNQSRAEERDHRQTFSMPKASKDFALKEAIEEIAKNSNQKSSQVVRQLCWEAIYHRAAIGQSYKLIQSS